MDDDYAKRLEKSYTNLLNSGLIGPAERALMAAFFPQLKRLAMRDPAAFQRNVSNVINELAGIAGLTVDIKQG